MNSYEPKSGYGFSEKLKEQQDEVLTQMRETISGMTIKGKVKKTSLISMEGKGKKEPGIPSTVEEEKPDTLELFVKGYLLGFQ